MRYRGPNLLAASVLIAAGLYGAAASHWIRLRSANFEMYSSASAGSSRDTLRQFEEIRGFFLQAFSSDLVKLPTVKLIAFSSSKEYEPYRPNEFATAYYHQTPAGDSIVMSHLGPDTFPIAVHEYVHLLVRHAGLKLPPWLNEGLAELYSTIHPVADKMLIGDLIPARHRALLEDKWVPIETILAVTHDSPYYNEKNKAGNFYNESWALTHMLYFSAPYRAKAGQLVRTISDGKESAAALAEMYGKSVPQVEKDLQSYLRGSYFQGVLVAAKFNQVSNAIPAEPLADFDSGLVLAELQYRTGKEAVYQAALERLVEQDPKRPEPFQSLGYLAWGGRRNAEAIEQFGKAFERGARDAKFLWDYGRLLEPESAEESARVFAELLLADAQRVDVRLELADIQLRAGHPEAALTTLGPLHAITTENAARFFRIAVTAHLRSGHQKEAEGTARHFMDLAKTDADRALAERLLDQAAPPKPRPLPVAPTPAVPPSEAAAPPKAAPDDDRRVLPPEKPPRATMAGQFVELQCLGKQARMILQTAAGRKVFLIENPDNIAIIAKQDGPVDMSCGRQKTPAKVEIGYDRPSATQTGVDGVVRSLVF